MLFGPERGYDFRGKILASALEGAFIVISATTIGVRIHHYRLAKITKISFLFCPVKRPNHFSLSEPRLFCPPAVRSNFPQEVFGTFTESTAEGTPLPRDLVPCVFTLADIGGLPILPSSITSFFFAAFVKATSHLLSPFGDICNLLVTSSTPPASP